MKGPYYNDVHPTVLWAGLGLPTTTNPTSGVFNHAFNLVNVPPSYTIARSLDAVTYYIPYSVLEKWILSFQTDGKLLELEGDYLGLYAQKYLSPPVPSYSTLLPFAGYAPTITTSAGASSDIIDMTMTFSQKITLWYPANGTQDFITVYFGERDVKLDFTARFDNDTLYNLWRNNVVDNFTFDVKGLIIGKVYTVTLGAPTAGTFTLTYNGQTTAGIAFNATAATVQTALTGLSSVGTNNATVSGAAGGPYTVNFLGPTLNDGNSLTGSGTGLTGGTFSVSAQTTYNQELNIALANISYDSIEHDLSKDNILVKAKATAIVPAGSALITGFIVNTISGYTT